MQYSLPFFMLWQPKHTPFLVAFHSTDNWKEDNKLTNVRSTKTKNLFPLFAVVAARMCEMLPSRKGFPTPCWASLISYIYGNLFFFFVFCFLSNVGFSSFFACSLSATVTRKATAFFFVLYWLVIAKFEQRVRKTEMGRELHCKQGYESVALGHVLRLKHHP